MAEDGPNTQMAILTALASTLNPTPPNPTFTSVKPFAPPSPHLICLFHHPSHFHHQHNLNPPISLHVLYIHYQHNLNPTHSPSHSIYSSSTQLQLPQTTYIVYSNTFNNLYCHFQTLSYYLDFLFLTFKID